MHAFILLAPTTLLTLTSVAGQGRGGNNNISTVFTTVTLPGFSVGINGTVPAATVTGTATIDDGVTIINDGESLYMIGTAGEQVRGGLSGMNIVDGVTVVNGQIVGMATTTRDDDGSSITSSGAAKTGSSRNGSLVGTSAAATTPTGGAMRAMVTAEVLGLLGLGTMAALVI
ncbi:hypothetical protein B0H13DRAFT_2322970 [Mycena leptocephala]|nr:hypothetical protein B0H13DRAFT_2322970 [Mycena leptocephala]